MYKLAKLSSKCLLLFNCEDITSTTSLMVSRNFKTHDMMAAIFQGLISYSQANLKGKRCYF